MIVATMVSFSIEHAFSVGNLPTSGQTQGITALPTVDGTGVLAQFNEKMWKFTCDSSSCSWNKESQELDLPVFHSVKITRFCFHDKSM